MNDGQRKTGQDTLSSPKGGLQKPLLLLLALLVLLALAAYGYSRLTRDRQPGLPGTAAAAASPRSSPAARLVTPRPRAP